MRMIDADALKKDLSEYNYDMALRIVDTQPTIEAEPVRHGRWTEETEPDENGNVISMCDQCCHTDEHCINIKVPYCWYCGAKMYDHIADISKKVGADNDN